MRITRLTLAALMLSACVTTATASVAAAADYPPSQHHAALTLPNGSSVGAGGSITIAGTDCGASQDVTVALDGTTMKTVTADASGAFSTAVSIPSNTSTGAHTITASNGNCSLTADITVTAAGDPNGGGNSGTLPRTGSSSTMPFTFVALAALAVGTALVVATRRRRRRYATTND